MIKNVQEAAMKTGFVLPRGDARTAADFAREAEAAGWDGFFVWEPVWGVDAWVCLTAAAMVTSRIRLGTMITPISRMRPWELAGKTATLDQLSGGRVILSVGLGAVDTGFAEFGEVTDRKTRAELLDEGLDILTGLWKGQPFSYNGKHYQIKPLHFPHVPPPPIQQPRIPIWVVGAWPSEKSLGRAIRYDGLLPAMMGKDGKVEMRSATPEEIGPMKAWIHQRRGGARFDIIVEGTTPGDDSARAAAQVRPYAEAGVTWWLEAMWEAPDLESVRARLRQGPPIY
jgi:alkanesulfonate monooxygenase SsuD/methylene tetrahydromethanopterin reductase-like flavin-dependent oxidoreductase (luciferase family)